MQKNYRLVIWAKIKWVSEANPKFKNYPFSVFGYLIDMIWNIFTRPQAVSKWFIKINNLIIIFEIRSHLRFESAGDQFPFCGDIETFFGFGGLDIFSKKPNVELFSENIHIFQTWQITNIFLKFQNIHIFKSGKNIHIFQKWQKYKYIFEKWQNIHMYPH